MITWLCLSIVVVSCNLARRYVQGVKLKYLRYIFPLLILTVVFGRDFYFDYRQEKRHAQLKEVIHGLLFDGDDRTM